MYIDKSTVITAAAALAVAIIVLNLVLPSVMTLGSFLAMKLTNFLMAFV